MEEEKILEKEAKDESKQDLPVVKHIFYYQNEEI